jgi:hypothetical protein
MMDYLNKMYEYLFYSVLFILGLEYKEPIQYSHDYLKKIDSK